MALICRRPLEEYLTKLNKPETALGPTRWAHGAIGKVRSKIGWVDGIRNQQGFLSVSVGMLKMSLAEQYSPILHVLEPKSI